MGVEETEGYSHVRESAQDSRVPEICDRPAILPLLAVSLFLDDNKTLSGTSPRTRHDLNRPP